MNINGKPKRNYFTNELVEWQLTKYIWTGCTDVKQRDLIMSHASELIRQIIRKQGLHTIYPGQEESAFGDLLQTAWVQIERTLYKYRARPHCRYCYNNDRPTDSALYIAGETEYGIKTIADLREIGIIMCPKCRSVLIDVPIIEAKEGTYGGSRSVLYRGTSKVFNMWSQVARTVILAYIKKEGRDRKNSGSYTSYIGNRIRPISDLMDRFIDEAKETCQYNDSHLAVIAALEHILETDDKPHDGIIGKLMEYSGMPRATVTSFMKIIRLRAFEFTDSPLNYDGSTTHTDRRRASNIEHDYDEE